MKRGYLLALAILSAATVAAAPLQRDGAVIRNSGSTNTAAYTITLWSDGAARVEMRGANSRELRVDRDVADHFFRDARASRQDPGIAHTCMKSASFGTATIVAWHGWNSPDLQCPPFSASVILLAADVRAVQAAANIDTRLHRVPLPHELRMIPSATPEVTPT